MEKIERAARVINSRQLVKKRIVSFSQWVVKKKFEAN
jgi:hypothetical protein